MVEVGGDGGVGGGLVNPKVAISGLGGGVGGTCWGPRGLGRVRQLSGIQCF